MGYDDVKVGDTVTLDYRAGMQSEYKPEEFVVSGILYDRDEYTIVIELKYAENGDMDAACSEALKQIEEKTYVDKLKRDGMRNFIKYGIACFKKDCKVVVSE